MKKIVGNISKVIFFLIAIRLISSPAFASDKDIDNIIFPGISQFPDNDLFVGVSMTILPRAIVDDEIRQVPVIDIRSRLWLPCNFSANIEISSVYIANQARAGIAFNYSYRNTSFSLGTDIAYWYGFARLDGFDTEAFGWILYPKFAAGIKFDDLFLTLSSELIIITSRETIFGGTTINNQKNEFSGFAIALAIEQPFWGNNDFLISGKLNFARSLYQSWLTFTTFDKLMLYPEFSVGFLL